MSGLGGWLRRRLGRPEPGSALIVVSRPAPLPLHGGPPRELPAPPPRPRRPSMGLGQYYGRQVVGRAGQRPARSGRPEDVSALVRDSADAWVWGRRQPLLPDPTDRDR